MKLRIEINDQMNEYDFLEKKIYIGSSKDCHIQLKNDSVASAHLEVEERQGSFSITHLAEGYKTTLNGEVLPLRKAVEYNSFFPAQIGEIYIYLVDQSLAVETQEDSLNDFSNSLDSQISDNSNSIEEDPLMALEKEISEANAREHEERKSNKKKKEPAKQQYRPKIDLSLENTLSSSSFKIKTPQVKKSKNNSRQKRKKLEEKSNLGSYLVFISGIVIALGLYYIQSGPSEITQVETKPQEEFVLTLKEDYLSTLTSNKLNYKKVLLGQKCENSVEKKVCSLLDLNKGSVKYEGAQQIGKSLFIALDETRLRELGSSFFTDVDQQWLKQKIKKEYSTYFSYDEFVNNGMKAPLGIYARNVNEYFSTFSAYAFLVNSKHSDIFDNMNDIENIHLFWIESFQETIKVNGFVQLSQKVYPYLRTLWPQDRVEITAQQKHYLTEGIEQFFEKRVAGHINKFDPKAFEELKKKTVGKKYQNLLSLDKCSYEFNIVCDVLRAREYSSRVEGVARHKNEILIYLDVKKIIEHYRKKYLRHEYIDIEKKGLIRKFSALRLNASVQDFLKKDYFYKKLPQKDLYTQAIIFEFFNLDLMSRLAKLDQQFEKIVLIGTQAAQDELLSVVVLKAKGITPLDKVKSQKYPIYLWRSHLPVYKNFLEEQAEVIYSRR
ncbi:MAG: hypothetical protein CME66_00485 [Halobacteriovoraceae bacterium]|nr:hypothetical protein [Halobacteriovoraceae bacterium]